MKKIQLALVACGVALLAAGCGGGGGGSTAAPAAAKVSITTTNASAVATKGVNASTQVSKTSSKGTTVKSAGKSSSLADIALAEFNRLKGMPLRPVATGVIANVALTCAGGGSAVESYQDTNNNGIFDMGDVATMTYTNCVNGGVTENGTMSMAFNTLTVTGTAPNQTLDFNVTTNFTNFKSASAADTFTTNGDMTLAIRMATTGATATLPGTTTMSLTISGNTLSTVSTVDGTFKMTAYSLGITMDAATFKTSAFSIVMTTDSGVLGGSITISTPTPFSDTTSPTVDFNAGVMRITGANGTAGPSYVELTARADGVHVGLTVDEGNGAGPKALADTTWALL